MPVYATCLIIGTLAERVAIINLEIMVLSASQARSIQEAVGVAIGLEIGNVWVFHTHNHAGPITLETYRGDGELEVRAYRETLPLLCAGAATQALKSLVPVRIAGGSGTCHIGVNRDMRLADGSCITAPNPDGFSDPEVGVIKIDSIDGQPVAIIANYACHPTILGHENRLISPDYPGVARRLVEDITGTTCIFLQGAAGNVGPLEGFTSDLRAVERQGAILGCEIAKIALETKTIKTASVLDGVIQSMSAQLGVMKQVEVDQGSQDVMIVARTVKLPTGNPFGHSYQEIGNEIRRRLAELAEVITIDSKPNEIINKNIAIDRLLWTQARGKRLLENDNCEVEIKILCIGDIALIGTWGEMFSETGFEIKKLSPFGQTIVAAYMGGDSAYLPPRGEYTNSPGLEVMNTPVAPGGAELMLDAILSLANDVHDERVGLTN